MNRREFLLGPGLALSRAAGAQHTSVTVESGAPAPVQRAASELKLALDGARSPAQVTVGTFKAPPESLRILRTRDGIRAEGADVRGQVYALLELADRARMGAPLDAPVEERAANRIRSVTRLFESDVEDKGWFHDRAMWREYLTMLATQRFNRFSLAFGLGYNFPRRCTDVYFYFAYPFLLDVPGYNVRARGLPDSERDRNVETLKFIGEETAARSLDFQVALWTHAYEWVDSPGANYTIEGLNPRNHAAYCRDALTALLKACPKITGVTFRVHGESGVPEGSYDFWRTVFDGVVRSGRRVEIDMHAKGMDQKTIAIALATGMPVNISPKYWAEHMGMPYHQAAIRDLEMPPKTEVTGTFALSAGSRRFLRYGYGDLLTEDRRYGVLHRIWPGTQRVLLWGDPAMAAGYGRVSSFCGSAGVELCEPLSFKGRMGSGKPGGRCAYADKSLEPRYDWEKYLYQYRVWGRSIYNPETDPDGWRRHLRKEFGAGAGAAEANLAAASRILPIVTTAHGASGSNNSYWPEMYTNMPVVDEKRKHPYGDTPVPRRFGTVSPFDPQLFSRVDDFADGLLDGRGEPKYSPLDVAQWLEDLGKTALRPVVTRNSPETRRFSIDAAIQGGLGLFFAAKLRAAVLWRIYDRTGDPAALAEALKAYRAARNAWAGLADRAKVYAADITYGEAPHLRGHWLDRVRAIDDDIADMEKRAGRNGTSAGHAIEQVLARQPRRAAAASHTPAGHFRPGEPLALELAFDDNANRSARLHYRHVNQAESWVSADMQGDGSRFRASIPGEYTRSRYPLQYYFEVRENSGFLTLFPGFGATFANLPYFVVRRA